MRLALVLVIAFIASVVAISPGARTRPALWVDNNNVVWLFGGLGYATANLGLLNDMWYFTNDTWTWIPSKNTSIGQLGIYGTKGIASPDNLPGSRTATAHWVDKAGNLWMFGGFGVDSNGNQGRLNDMWLFNVTSFQWMWVSGTKNSPAIGVNGNSGQSSKLFFPGARYFASFTTDDAGDFWLFGGDGFTSNVEAGDTNDLWKFSPTTREWAWFSGATNSKDVASNYGDLGVASPGNVIGGRDSASAWFTNGCIYIFGGWGYANVTSNTTSTRDALGDMWRYNVSTNEWTWISGTPNRPQYAVFGTKGQPSANSMPGGREIAHSWRGDDGLLYLFAGKGFVAAGAFSSLSDLWTYNVQTGLWTWIDGSDQLNTGAVFTTKGAAGNIIGAMNSAAFFYKKGKAYVYGGEGLSNQLTIGFLSLLWTRDTNAWNWVSGDTQTNQLSVYPVIKTPTSETPNPIPPTTAPVAAPVNIVEIVVPSVIVPVCVGVALFVLIFLLLKKKTKKRKAEEARLEAELEMKRINDLQDAKYDALPLNIETPADMQLIPRSAIELVKEIGAGSFGKVFKARYKMADVAVKVSNLNTSTQDFIKEASFQMNIPPHPHIVQLLGISLDGINVLVVLEFCDRGSLDRLLFDNDDTMTEAQQLDLARQVAKGLRHLHENNIVHRDLASRNVLITSTGDLKISDFGMSRKLQEEEDVGKTATNVGPIRWMAPESIGSRTYSKKTDIWTFGMILYEIVARKEPHAGKDLFEIAVLIRDKGLTPNIPDGCPETLATIMKMCWQQDPKDRPDIEQICDILDK